MNIANVIIWMKKEAYEDSTTRKVAKILRHLQRNCNTADPENVKLYVSKKTCGNGRKENLIEAYALYLRSMGIEWKDQPFYQRYDKKRRAPKQELLDFMINHFRLSLALKLSMMKDLGTRPIELTWLRVQDIELTTGNVSITGAKHTFGRYGKLKTRSLEMLKAYIKKHNLNRTSKLLNVSSDQLTRHFCYLRSRLAESQQDPEYKNISLYDFRRFKATMEYHRTKDERYVRALLGHKDARALNRYIVLLQTIEGDEYITKVAKTPEEAAKLAEAGFEKFDEFDDIRLYRKRK